MPAPNPSGARTDSAYLACPMELVRCLTVACPKVSSHAPTSIVPSVYRDPTVPLAVTPGLGPSLLIR
jgi:hypothetical protein